MGNADSSNVIIYIERGTVENLMSNDIISRDKELIAVYDKDELIGHKLGNGKSKWSELDYIDLDSIDEFKVYDKKRGYICKIVLNPIDKLKD